MKTDPYDDQLEAALSSLKEADQDLSDVEHGVWSEIAIRGKGAPAWLSLSLPAPALAACCVLAVAAGSIIGLTRAQAYEKESSLAVEQRYVESIHPVMRSADHSDHDH